jgi:hypothetical protein
MYDSQRPLDLSVMWIGSQPIVVSVVVVFLILFYNIFFSWGV